MLFHWPFTKHHCHCELNQNLGCVVALITSLTVTTAITCCSHITLLQLPRQARGMTPSTSFVLPRHHVHSTLLETKPQSPELVGAQQIMTPRYTPGSAHSSARSTHP